MAGGESRCLSEANARGNVPRQGPAVGHTDATEVRITTCGGRIRGSQRKSTDVESSQGVLA